MAEDSQQDIKNCPYFCGEYLQDLPEELKEKVVELLHNVMQKQYPDPLSVSQGLLKEISSDDVSSFRYAVILKQLCFSLLKASESDGALKLIEGRVEELNKEDYRTLMILGVVQEKNGDYENAKAAYQRANDLKEENSKLQDAYSVLKLATSCWHLQDPEMSRHYFQTGMELLNEFDATKVHEEEEVVLLTDCYKTIGYFSRVSNDHGKCLSFYSKASDLISKHGCSIVQELKVLSQIASAHARNNEGFHVAAISIRSDAIIDEILANTPYVSVHTTQIIHLLSRMAFACKSVKNREDALRLHEKNLKIARDFLGDAHPEVARIAVDTAIVASNLQQHRRSAQFVDLCEESLQKCNYKNDESKMKLYVREISDSLSNLALFHMWQSNFSQAEEYYKEALDVNTKVYGESSLRTAKVLRFLGRTYNRWKKFDLAREYIRKALTIHEQYQPDNVKVLQEMATELLNVGVETQRRPRRPKVKGF